MKGDRKIKHPHKTALRTIVCLPKQWVDQQDTDVTNHEQSCRIPFPRGKLREQLFECGLIAKMTIVTSWNAGDMSRKIEKLFKHNFPSESEFGFFYLTTFCGLRSLSYSKVNQFFVWDAKAVLSLHRTTIHILSDIKHETFKVGLIYYFAILQYPCQVSCSK